MNSPQLALRITLAALCAPPTYQFRSAGRQHARMAARHAYRGTGGRFFALPVPCAGSAKTCVSQASSIADVVREQNAKNKVVVYSKSYCPYCAQVKGLFNKLNVDYKLFELDQLADGQDVQNALYDVTSRRTVPQVFVDGKFLGGCDDTTGMYQSGELKTLFQSAGVTADM